MSKNTSEAVASNGELGPRWPHRYEFFRSIGYVVWRDVFEGAMRCAHSEAVMAHKVAVFVTETEAANYCDYRNAMTMLHGTDDVEVIRFDWPNAIYTAKPAGYSGDDDASR